MYPAEMCHIKVIQSDYMSITIMWVLKWIFANNMAEKCAPTVPSRDDRHLRCSVPCRSSVCKGLNLGSKLYMSNSSTCCWPTESLRSQLESLETVTGHHILYILLLLLLLIWQKCQTFVACSFPMHFFTGVGLGGCCFLQEDLCGFAWAFATCTGKPETFDAIAKHAERWDVSTLKIMKEPNRNKNNMPFHMILTVYCSWRQNPAIQKFWPKRVKC